MKNKKWFILIAVLIVALTFALALSACDETPDGGETPPSGGVEPPPVNPPSGEVDNKNVTVTAKSSAVSIKNTEIENYNFTSLFSIVDNGYNVLIQGAYLDLSGLPSTVGAQGDVVCTYKGKSAKVTVTLTETAYTLTLSQDSVQVTTLNALEYDYLALFEATVDGGVVAITEDMVTSTVIDEVGNYTFTVTNGTLSKTLRVEVVKGHYTQIVANFNQPQIAKDEIATFDFKTLFSLYFDGESVEVTDEMIDASAILGDVTVGERYNVTLSAQNKELNDSLTVSVQVVAPSEIVITARNVDTYPNAEYIDLTTLFEISIGSQQIPVTADMISGKVNYATVGENVITLTYEGQQKTATVSVKRGVVIFQPHGDTIVIRKGTDINSYAFSSDFSVVVNGIKYHNTYEFIDKSQVDFSTVGTYTATISVPYNENKSSGLRPPTYTYVEETITYVVVEKSTQVDALQELVLLPSTTTSYNVFSNIDVRVNGYKMTLTDNLNVAQTSPLAIYAELLTPSIDLTSVSRQPVRVNVYVMGVDETPQLVEFEVQVKSNLKVEAHGKVVFDGATLYTKDLFEITIGKEVVEVTQDMIDGYVNTFVDGVYSVTINYLGIEQTAKVVVLDDEFLGTYNTTLTTIPVEEDTNDDVDAGNGWGNDDLFDEWYGTASVGDNAMTSAATVTRYGKMTISADGEIVVNGKKAELVDGIDNHTLIIKIGTNKYTLHYEDGIIMLNPQNEVKMTFNDYMRPLAYFNESVWTLDKGVAINSNSKYILAGTTTGYSIDIFHITSKVDASVKWWGFKTQLVDKTGADSIYQVTWGYTDLDGNFETQTDVEGVLTLLDETYSFVMLDRKTAQIKKAGSQYKFANKNFAGTIDGKNAVLQMGTANYKLYVNGAQVFSITENDVTNMKNGYVDEIKDEVFFYMFTAEKYFSYKFSLDVDSLSFTVVPMTGLYGLYECENKYIYLDGYGTGLMSFGTSSYGNELLKYTQNGNEVVLNFVDKTGKFAYGKQATLYLDPFGNVLIANRFENTVESETRFANSRISGGAIVTIATTQFAQNTSADDFYKTISIVTKDGALEGDALKACIDKTAVNLSYAGIYQYTITLDVFGETVVGYYSAQVMGKKYISHALLGTYTAVSNNTNSIIIDEFGQATVISGQTFKGEAILSGDEQNGYKFVIFAHNDDYGSITVTGESLKQGLVNAKSTGAVAFNDFYTTGRSNVAGVDKTVLKQIKLTGENVYVYAPSASSLGEIVDVEVLSGSVDGIGSVVAIKATGGDVVVKILEWGNVTAGLQLNDGLRGTYSKGAQSLVLDGFSNATLDGMKGVYMINVNRSITVEWVDGTVSVLDVDKSQGTFAMSAIALNNSLLQGKTLVATHTFVCENDVQGYAFEATTKFVFMANGQVKIISTSQEHDDGEYMCGYDLYNPPYASSEGVIGAYSVSATKLTINVTHGGVQTTFTFKIVDVSVADTIVCTSTTLDDTMHGYFKVEQVFETAN